VTDTISFLLKVIFILENLNSELNVTLKKTEISAIILAGGIGKRMGRKNKGLLIFRGKPLIEHVIEKLHDQVSAVVISCNEELEQYRRYHYPIATDILNNDPSKTDNNEYNKEGNGPLAGLLSAGRKITTPYCFITACDMPFLPKTIVLDLASAIGDKDAISIKTRQGTEPLVSLVRTSSLQSIEHHLTSNRKSVKSWLATLSWTTLDSDSEQQFINLNHPEELH
jgi:molybdopterin-guanine dinucleotide biosynthesis protein A